MCEYVEIDPSKIHVLRDCSSCIPPPGGESSVDHKERVLQVCTFENVLRRTHDGTSLRPDIYIFVRSVQELRNMRVHVRTITSFFRDVIGVSSDDVESSVEEDDHTEG